MYWRSPTDDHPARGAAWGCISGRGVASMLMHLLLPGLSEDAWQHVGWNGFYDLCRDGRTVSIDVT